MGDMVIVGCVHVLRSNFTLHYENKETTCNGLRSMNGNISESQFTISDQLSTNLVSLK